jgi:phage-related protein
MNKTLTKTFVWNNKRAEDMNIKTISLPDIKLSTERKNETVIPGRDGFLTELDGYDGDTKQVTADYIGTREGALKVAQWLKGEGEIVFGDLPDRYYQARINNMIPISQILANEKYTFPIEFRCQPYGYLLDGKEEITITSGTVLNHNKADTESLPIITINGTGPCTFAINNRTFNISEIGGSITINSLMKLVYNDKGDKMTGRFPYLDIGENTITFSGTNINSVSLIPNWRCY